MLTHILTLAAGHATAAFLFYSTHRWILHPRSRLPILRALARQHRTHHAQPGDPGHFFFSWWVNILIWSITAGVTAFVPAFGVGMVTYYGAYAYYHRSSHYKGQSKAARHHQGHHYVSPRTNYAVVYPIMDKIFGTARYTTPEELDSRMERIKKV